MSRASDLEERFRWASEALVQPASPRWKLSALNAFLSGTRGDRAAVEAYLLELAEPIQALIEELDVGGLSGAFLEETAVLIGEALDGSRVLRGEPLLVRARDSLMRVAAGRYACVNDLHSTWRALEQVAEPPGWWIDITRIPNLGVHERLDRLVEAAHRAGHPVRESLDALVHVARSALADGPHAACTAVIEYGFRPDASDIGIGGIRLLRVEILAAREEHDDVRPDVMPTDLNAHGRNGFSTAVAAGRRLLDRVVPAARGRFLTGRILFEAPGIPHSGQSADLAVAALFFSAAQDFLRLRRRYEIAPVVAFTGSVDEDARVLPIAEETLDMKVEAAFHSWDRVLVVPFAQVVEARVVADRLNAAFPGRDLDVVGAQTMDDLLNDRRVMREVVTPRSLYLARGLWRRRWGVAGFMATVTLAVALILAVVGPIDRNPVSVEPSATGMVLSNARGREVSTIVTTARWSFPSREEGAHRVALGDTDGDGSNEVCWYEASDGDAVPVPTISCAEVGADEPFFVLPLIFEGLFPTDPQIATSRFQGVMVHLADVDGDRRAELVIGANHGSLYPALVLVHDPRTGREMGRYVHAGALVDMELRDLDGNGLPEILAAAFNNALDQGVFMVLDPRNLEGTSPTSLTRMPASYDPGKEIAYVRFPPGPLSSLPVVTGGRNVQSVDVWTSDRLVVVTVSDGRRRDAADSGSGQPSLLYQFSYDLRPVACVSNTDFDRLERDLVADGYLDSAFSAQDRRAQIEAIEYWDGSVWRDSVWTRFR